MTVFPFNKILSEPTFSSVEFISDGGGGWCAPLENCHKSLTDAIVISNAPSELLYISSAVRKIAAVSSDTLIGSFALARFIAATSESAEK